MDDYEIEALEDFDLAYEYAEEVEPLADEDELDAEYYWRQ